MQVNRHHRHHHHHHHNHHHHHHQYQSAHKIVKMFLAHQSITLVIIHQKTWPIAILSGGLGYRYVHARIHGKPIIKITFLRFSVISESASIMTKKIPHFHSSAFLQFLVLPSFCPLCALFLPFLNVSCVVAIALFLPSFCPLLQV